MCKELESELQQGKAQAEALVQHLHSMGAAKATIPVVVDGVEYEVIVSPKGEAPAPKPRAWMVPCPKGHEHDYLVFADEYEAYSFACGENIDGEGVVPLYAEIVFDARPTQQGESEGGGE